MPLTPRQELMLSLAGTVRLPSPPPATGCVWTVAPGSGEVRAEDIVFRVVHRVSNRLWIERIVRMTDVRAILAPWGSPTEDSSSEHGYRTYAQFHEEATTFAREHRHEDSVWKIDAVAYVDETASVVLATEASLTAAESSEYYPPIIHEGHASARGLRSRLAILQPDDCNDHRGLQP